MTARMTEESRRRSARVLVSVVVLGVLGLVLVLLGPGLLGGLRAEGSSLLTGPECIVQTSDGEIRLTRDEAKLGTTAVALRARGTEANTSGIDEGALRALAEGPLGDAGPVLSCRGSAADDLQQEQLTATGLTPRAEQVRSAMTEVFGDQSLGGFEPGGVGSGHGGDSTHYDGRAIDIFFRPVTEENRREGWILAHWLVAHAEDLDVQYVIFDDQFWSARVARGQWHDYEAPAPANEILRHLDHVHVDVLGGETR
ncbi:MAG: hypothetical protein JWM61_437 [Micrococcaceae bacterium]|jgi:hypothetical protein|nr:hypothetical protein [Micrococcaceae bacterium]